MTANPWLIALHLVALFLWVGHLLVTPRLLAHSAGLQEDHQERTWLWLRRSWNTTSPAGLLVFITGLLMLHGVGMPGSDPATSLGTYLSPRQTNGHPTWSGEPSYWYITFHVKLVSAILLALFDFWLGAQIRRLGRKQPPKSTWPLTTLLALTSALLANTSVWLILASNGMGPSARYAGYVAGAVGMAIGILMGRKLGRGDSRAKYMAVHGLIAALMVLIVVMIIARPVAYGGHTLP